MIDLAKKHKDFYEAIREESKCISGVVERLFDKCFDKETYEQLSDEEVRLLSSAITDSIMNKVRMDCLSRAYKYRKDKDETRTVR